MIRDHALQEFQQLASALDTRFSEGILARTMLAALDGIDAGVIQPARADAVFTDLDRRLTESTVVPPLSDEAQELIFEGEHLHHAGDPYGPDTARLRQLARTILARESQR